MSSEPGVESPPPGGDVDRANTYIAVCWTGVGLSLAAVVLRCHSRRMVNALNWEDHWMIITEVSSEDEPCYISNIIDVVNNVFFPARCKNMMANAIAGSRSWSSSRLY